MPEPHDDLLRRIDSLVSAQRATFHSGATRSLSGRAERLRSLADVIERHQADILDACREDLGRGDLEARASEVALPLGEVAMALRSLRRWARPRRSLPALVNLPSVGVTRHEPLGSNLIISPWNYPFLLTLSPLTSCVAAGNVALVKPSELAPASSALMASMLAEAFDPAHVAVVEGGVDVGAALLEQRFDHYFFTGSTRVGRLVARAAAEHLAKATLELGGKSPTIVTATADLAVAARRIAMGKLFNTGQSCVAPDYVLVHRSVHDAFVEELGKAIDAFFGPHPETSPDYGRIVNEAHFDRLVGLIEAPKVARGGGHDRSARYIEPTILVGVTTEDAVMREEIFGPILPVLIFDEPDEIAEVVAHNPNPLALYVFSSDPEDHRRITEQIPYGGGCFNTTLLHFADSKLPLGGVGESGLGVSHGVHCFETFSRRQGVLYAPTGIDPSVRYPPYGVWKRRIVRWLMG